MSRSVAEKEISREDCLLRKARPEDLPEMERVYEAARQFMIRSGNPTQWIDSDGTRRPTREQLQADIHAGKSYVLEVPRPEDQPDGQDTKRTIGAVFFYDFGEAVEPTYARIDGDWQGDEHYGVVHRIASDGRVKGAGRLCLRWAMERSGHLRIDTHANNQPMQHVLGMLGFVLCGTIYLASGDSRLAYEWINKG